MTEQQRFDTLYETLTVNGALMHAGLLLQRAANKWPDHLAVICQDTQITYKDLFTKSQQLAQQLILLGLNLNDRVILYYENSVEFYVAYFAIWQAGGIVAPLNVFLHETELLGILDDSKPKIVIVSPTLHEKLKDYHHEQLPIIISDVYPAVANEHGQKEEDLNKIIERNCDDTAAILYTSGTTGFPKGVMLSSRAIITNAIQGIARFDVHPKDRVFCPLPLFHSLPQNICVWSNTILGSTAIIIPKIDRSNILAAIKHKPDMVVAVPAIYGLFCMLKTIDFGNVRYFASGGDALSDKIRAYFSLLYRRKICNGYGLTETAPFISVDVDDYTQPTNTVGKPFVGIKVSIRDENNNELKSPQIGVLWISSDSVMTGYYNSPEATDSILQNGWLNTGDLAYLDDDGKIILSGRVRDLIINKGIKIYPQEVENILLSNSSVLQAAVVGLLQNEEEIPVAFIASKTKQPDLLIEELTKLCKANLAFYKVPRQFIIRQELPLTTTGKVDKKKLKKDL